MKIVKYVLLEIILLAVLLLCGTVVIKIFDVFFKLDFENIWILGFKACFIAWLASLVVIVISQIKGTKK